MNEALKGFLVFIIIIAVVAGGAYGYYKTEINGTFRDNEEVVVPIAQGSTNSEIASQLEESGVIGSALLFRLYLRQGDYVLQYGDFTLNKSSGYDALIEALQIQQVVATTTEITIPEGSEVKQIIQILVDAGIGTAEEITNVINYDEFEYDFVNQLVWDEEESYRLEGYLFPDTYELYTDESPHDVIARLLDNFDKKTSNLRKEAELNERNFADIITMASIVEREAQDLNEYAKVAGVFYNRLEDEMLLESCATVQYVMEERKDVLTDEDTKIESPFNTYQNAGLTPNPISNPGMEAIRAAMYPEETDYYYFVAAGDGTHYFAETYDGHLWNIAQINAAEEE